MASGFNQEQFVRELLDALRHGTFTRNPNASDRINRFAERVKRRLDELTNILDERGLQHYTGAIDLVESLKAKLESAMDNRRTARTTAAVGTILRIGGTLGYATPFGQVVFWGGFAMSTLSDMIAADESREVDDISSKIRGILERDEDCFRAGATAIRNLDDAIRTETGYSLYDETFQEFLRNAAEAPRRAENSVACRVDNPEYRTNLVEIARNRDLLVILNSIIEGFEREDVMFLNAVTHVLLSISFVECTPETSAAFQVGELAVRGVNLYIEYKKDKLTLKEFEKGLSRMRKELEALRKIYPDM